MKKLALFIFLFSTTLIYSNDIILDNSQINSYKTSVPCAGECVVEVVNINDILVSNSNSEKKRKFKKSKRKNKKIKSETVKKKACGC